jgi:hypothetical protein
VSLKTRGLLRQFILVAVCALGTLGILASGSSGGGGGGEDDSCGLSIQGIAPAADSTGDIWVGVLSKTAEGDYHSVSRLRSDGTEKASYAFGYAAGENLVKVVATDIVNAENKVYVGGDFAGGILRLNADGSLDDSFDVGVGFDGRVTSIVPADDGTGNIYVGGFFDSYDITPFISGFVRLNSSGSLDSPAFTAAPIADVEGIALAVDGFFPGNLYTAGISGSSGVDRWNNSGEKDPNFTSPVTPVITVTAAADGLGTIYVGGTASVGVVRVNVRGSSDGIFGANIGTGFDADILSIVRADDMTFDIYAGGRFTTFNDASARGIARLQPTGLPAVGFSIGGGFTNNSNDPDPFSQVYSLARASDGTDIYVGGGFAFYDGIRSNGIVRLNDDGSLDSDFAVEIAAEKRLCTNDTIPGLD